MGAGKSRWIPFDPARNFPDLGPRFEAGERIARGRLRAAKLAALPPALRPLSTHLSPGSLPPPAKVVDALRSSTTAARDLLDEDPGPQWGDDEGDFAELDWSAESVEEDERDLSWAAVLKRTFEAYVRGERPNLYGEWIAFAGEEEYD